MNGFVLNEMKSPFHCKQKFVFARTRSCARRLGDLPGRPRQPAAMLRGAKAQVMRSHAPHHPVVLRCANNFHLCTKLNFQLSIVGSVVECSPATRAARVRFPDDASSLFAPRDCFGGEQQVSVHNLHEPLVRFPDAADVHLASVFTHGQKKESE